jgi:hypothetical protein
MIPESKLKSDCTPEIIKKMVELAEGFEYYENEEGDKYYSHKKSEWIPILVFNPVVFPLLIHRAVGGWNLFNENIREWIEVDKQQVSLFMHGVYRYEFKKYAPHVLTSAECAMLHCLIEVLKG